MQIINDYWDTQAFHDSIHLQAKAFVLRCPRVTHECCSAWCATARVHKFAARGRMCVHTDSLRVLHVCKTFNGFVLARVEKDQHPACQLVSTGVHSRAGSTTVAAMAKTTSHAAAWQGWLSKHH